MVPIIVGALRLAATMAGPRAGGGTWQTRSGLRSYEPVHPRYIVFAGDVHRPTRRRPTETQQFASVREDLPDIGREIREGVSRMDPLASCVHEAASVGVDEAANEEMGHPMHQPALPSGQKDRAKMLLARCVLGKETGPCLGVRVHFDVAARSCVTVDLAAGQNLPHRRSRFVDDPRIGAVQVEPELIDAPCVR